MSIVDRFISRVSPTWALNRARASIALGALRRVQGNDADRLRRTRIEKQSQNTKNRKAAEKVRGEARWLEETLDVASGALDVLVSNVVGAGIQPEPQVELMGGESAEAVNRELLRIFDDWIYVPEVTRQFDYYSLQGITARSWFRDGEAFGQMLLGDIPGLDHGTIAPYSLEVVEADFVPVDLEDASRGIVQGVEVNEWGKPRAYHFYKAHPGDANTTSIATKRVSADRIIHLKMTKRLHALRGMSIFQSVITRLGDIKEIDESERVAARVAAAMAAYIKKGSPDTFQAADATGGEAPALRQMEFVPGMIFDDLLPGEEIGTISNSRPNNALIPFRDSQLRSGAAGLGTSYSSLSKNYNGTYSAQRQELVEQYVSYRRLSGAFIFRFCQPVWDGFVTSVLAAGAIKLPRDVNMATIYNATHTPPPMPWIDPLKEASANELMEKRGYKSRSRIIRERGENPDQVNREIARDQKEVEKLGLKLGDTPKPSTEEQPDDEEIPKRSNEE